MVCDLIDLNSVSEDSDDVVWFCSGGIVVGGDVLFGVMARLCWIFNVVTGKSKRCRLLSSGPPGTDATRR
ncbi:hypothetical protein HanXRQr2_Chr07g0307851 [Helianthus annuus]|uniref:Uncharacterized protein n=1 Tax=Helianthus annuus TaxID=4232 RepID=A0A9K3ING6_HELAN|nr:hypothetical protein HanXRQr2_Chr07g0307851 [Helianthus annuus]